MVSKAAAKTALDHKNSSMSWSSLSSESISRIEKAITEAEKSTLGEIVPVIVRRSFDLEETKWFSAIVFSLLYLMMFKILILLDSSVEPGVLFQLGLVVAVVIGFLFGRSKVGRQIFVSSTTLQKLANARAELEFHRNHVGQTKGYTGILLFLALEDRQAIVLGDKAINDKIEQSEWNQVLQILVSHLKKNSLELGLISSVQECGKILSTHFPSQSHVYNENELRDILIIKD